MVYCHANGHDHRRTLRPGAQHIARWATRRSALQCAACRAESHLTASLKATSPTNRPTAHIRARNVWSSEKYLRFVPEAVRSGAREVLGWDVHSAARRASPPDADRGRPRWARSWSPIACSGWKTRCPAENQAKLPPDPPAHHHAAGGGRSLQLHLGLQAADRGTADRLHPRHRRPCRRHHPSAPHRRFGRSLQVRTGCHGATDLSPVCMGAALHFDLSIPNFGIQE